MAKKSRKILEISSYPPPRAGWGIRVAFVMEGLREAGHSCQVINIAPESRRIPSSEYLTSMNGLDYTWKCFWWSLKGYRIHMHINGNSPKGFILAVIAHTMNLITFKRPVITMHAGPLQLFFPKERSRKWAPVIKYLFSSARRVICNSPAVKAKIIDYGIPEKKIISIPAFSRQYLRFKPLPMKSELQEFSADKDILLCSYNFFRPEFFIDRMMRALAILLKDHPRVGLMMLGSTDNSEEIRELIKELGIENHVYFAGDLTKEDFLTHVSRSDIMVRTPIRDGVASSVLEGLALGVPVVASENNRRPPSTITYDHENIEEMAAVLKETIDNLETVKQQVVKPEIRDTVADEVAVLTEV